MSMITFIARLYCRWTSAVNQVCYSIFLHFSEWNFRQSQARLSQLGDKISVKIIVIRRL